MAIHSLVFFSAYYMAELCSCSTTPDLQFTYDIETKRFKVTLTNLPEYLDRMEVAIVMLSEYEVVVEMFSMVNLVF